MKRKYLYASLLLAGAFVSCESDINTDGSNEVNNIDTTTINDKAKDTIGVELLISDKYLILDDKEERFLYYAAQEGMMAVNSVLLPEGDNPAMPDKSEASSAAFENPDFVSAARLADVSDGNYAFMHTVTAALNDSFPVIMGEKRVNDKVTNDYSDNFVIYQKQDGTQRNKYVYNNVFRFAPYGIRFLYDNTPAVGSNGKDTLVAKVQTGLLVGVYEEANDTIIWTHHPKAFNHLNMANTGGTRFYQMIPPTITYSSKFGFLMFLGSQIDAATRKPGYILRVNPSATSEDEMVTEVALKKHQADSKGWAPQLTKDNKVFEDMQRLENVVVYSVETDDLSKVEVVNGIEVEKGLPKGSLIMFGMNKEKVFQAYYRYKEGDQVEDITFSTAYQVNFEGTQSKHSPINVIVNPLNKRLEVVHATPYLMTLYSLSAEEFASDTLSTIGRKEWKKEAVLLDRDISIRGNGLYPTGTQMVSPDALVFSSYMSNVEKMEHTNPSKLKPGVQRIFFCSGNEYPSRIGVFELVRSLDTEKLSTWITTKRAIIEGQTY